MSSESRSSYRDSRPLAFGTYHVVTSDKSENRRGAHLSGSCVNQELADLAPVEPWGNSRQNRLHGMRIVGNTQLVWNGQQ